MQSQAEQDAPNPKRREQPEATLEWVSYRHRDHRSDLSQFSITREAKENSAGDALSEQVPAAFKNGSLSELEREIVSKSAVKTEVGPATKDGIATDQTQDNLKGTGFFSWLFGKAQDGFFSGICYYGVTGQLLIGACRSLPGGESPWSHFITAAIFGVGLWISWNKFKHNEQNQRRLESSDGD